MTVFLLSFNLTHSWSRRRRIKKFFGIKNSDKLAIYIPVFSSADGLMKTTSGALGVFDSLAVPYAEFDAAANFRERFKFILPPLSDQQNFFNKLFISDIHIDILPSNLQPTKESLITVGGTTYNAISSEIETKHNNKVKIIDGRITVPNIPGMGDGYSGFIQKITDKNVCFFYVAGLSTFGSAAALHYLSNNWDKLEKKYDDHDFLVIIQFEYPSFILKDMIYEKDLSE